MTKGEYVNRVLFLLNEPELSERDEIAIEGADNSGVLKHITDVYVDAWRKCLTIVPHSWVNIANFAELPHDTGDGSGWLTLPGDWYLLYCFRMTGWQRDVYRCALEGDEVAKMQGGQFSRGTPLHPVCVEGYSKDGERILRYYSLPKGIRHDVATALYIPMCKRIDSLDNNSDLGLDTRLKDVLCHFAASMVYLRYENFTAAKGLESEAVKLTHRIMVEQDPQKV